MCTCLVLADANILEEEGMLLQYASQVVDAKVVPNVQSITFTNFHVPVGQFLYLP